MNPSRPAAVRKTTIKPTRAPRPRRKTLGEEQAAFTAEGAPPPGRVGTGPALGPGETATPSPAASPKRDDAPKPP